MVNKNEAREKAKKYVESLKKNGELKILIGKGAGDEPAGLLSGGDEDDLELLRDIKQSNYSK